MTVHYRRRRLSRMDELGALSVSILAGLAGAGAAYYLTRLYLSKEKLGNERVSGPDARPSLPTAGGTSNADD